MSSNASLGLQGWVERISEHELPALYASVQRLEQLAKSESSSLVNLGQAILHDQGLTSRILRVVNSAHYRRGRHQVTTVSRAAVILGYDALKHICITATLIESLLKNRDISRSLYRRVLTLMARSLYAAMLSRMLMSEREEETREEVYIAALLHDVGELAFWSIGGGIQQSMDQKLSQSPLHQREMLVREALGTSFDKLSAALVSHWNMGEMLALSLSDPNRRTPELRLIEACHRLSAALIAGDQPHELKQALADLSELTGRERRPLNRLVQQCTEDTTELARSYGASVLAQLLQSGNLDPALSELEPEDSPYNRPDELLQLKMLRDMTLLASEKRDINLLINTTVEGLSRALGMDRVMVMMLNPAKDTLLTRFLACVDKVQARHPFNIGVSALQQHIFNHVLVKQEMCWIGDRRDSKWARFLPPQLVKIIGEQPFLLGPMILEGKAVGVFYVDRKASGRPLNESDFESFQHIVSQANLCFAHTRPAGRK